ncbi:GNAT family N-acetyltransferase [Paraburkholderia sejongensis]|uniref:GNAT family N-acetyltransferase n=1 Tax=Paraburkholderia sejongensis TaxID=2886946 RepID=UPI0022A80E70|nr:GNAT family N-acetyltransferase [Paraburkholderia sp. MMS20-SJTR3]
MLYSIAVYIKVGASFAIWGAAMDGRTVTRRKAVIRIRPQEDSWVLDHLYVLPEHQRKGIGAAVLRDVFAQADAKRVPIHLGALRGSDSNRFYQRHGFIQTDEAEWDIYYLRQPRRTNVEN